MFSKEEFQLILAYKPHIQDFVESNMYKEICKSNLIYKEKTFRHKDSDRIIIGIFDLVFVNDDHVSVLDYKTDHITNKNEEKDFIEKHRVQLEYYKEVLQKYFKKDVKGYVYYLEKNQCIEV